MLFSFFPHTIYQTISKISGEIVVKEQFGQYKLYVQGVLQSGGIIKNIWRKPLRQVTRSTPHATRCLVLGLGGGTVVQLIKQYYSNVKITAVELDPEIIKIGRKYFGLSKIKNLKIIQADAFKWVTTHSNDTYHWSRKQKEQEDTSDGGREVDLLRGGGERRQFDLIIVDLYLGKKFPRKAETKKFLENVKKLLSKNGLAVFNRLRSRGGNLGGFEEKLKKYFSSVERVKTVSNLFFICC